jgi:excisionase family DNA binding protein
MSISRLLTPDQAASLLQISKQTVHKLCRERKLEYVEVNKKERRFTEKQIEEYILAQTVKKPGIDNKPRKRLPCPLKGGEKEKSLGCSRNDLRKEIRSLCH